MRRLLFALLLALSFLRLVLLFRLNIHWDEFFYLSQVFDLRAGRLGDGLQTFHTRIFQFLTWLPLQEPDLIILGRCVMFLCSCGSMWLLLQVAEGVLSKEKALLAVILWASMAETLVHAQSFRSDPLCFLLVLLALNRLGRGERHNLFGAGLVLGLAAAISLKSFLYFILFLPLFSIKRDRLLVSIGAALLCFLVLVSCHQFGIVPRSDIGALAPEANVVSSIFGRFRDFVRIQGGTRSLALVARSLMENPVLWILFLGGIACACLRRAEVPKAYLKSLAVFLGILLFYRNTFPYFLPEVVFPLCLLAVRFLPERGYGLIIVAIFFSASFSGLRWWNESMSEQRKFIADIHQAYPNPVPYIDRCGMISSFPKVGPFLSTLVFERYKGAGKPLFREVLAEHKPAFLIQNSPCLKGFSQLLPEDQGALKEYFRPEQILGDGKNEFFSDY